jgi:FtsZ-binding cell division protein ZapB
MKLLEAEMDELDEEGDRLVQDRRMAEAEKNEKLRNRADAAEVHDAIREAGALNSFRLFLILSYAVLSN